MKKLLAAIIAVLMCGSILCGCINKDGDGGGKDETETEQPDTGSKPSEEETPPVEEKDWFELLSDDVKNNLSADCYVKENI